MKQTIRKQYDGCAAAGEPRFVVDGCVVTLADYLALHKLTRRQIAAALRDRLPDWVYNALRQKAKC